MVALHVAPSLKNVLLQNVAPRSVHLIQVDSFTAIFQEPFTNTAQHKRKNMLKNKKKIVIPTVTWPTKLSPYEVQWGSWSYINMKYQWMNYGLEGFTHNNKKYVHQRTGLSDFIYICLSVCQYHGQCRIKLQNYFSWSLHFCLLAVLNKHSYKSLLPTRSGRLSQVQHASSVLFEGTGRHWKYAVDYAPEESYSMFQCSEHG